MRSALGAGACTLRAIFRPAAPPQAEKEARIFYRFASDGARKRARSVCDVPAQGCTAFSLRRSEVWLACLREKRYRCWS
jgi:hypothetical protein